MKSTDKIIVTVEPYTKDGETKLWCFVRDAKTGEVLLVPSFEDMHRINFAISYCERMKYQTLSRDPADMVRRFHMRSMDATVALLDRFSEYPPPAWAYESTWAKLASEFKIPDRAPQKIDPPAQATTTTCAPGCTCDLCRLWPMKVA